MDIRVKITRDNSNRIVVLNLEEYLRGVVPAEMPASSPQEALRAQAVAARTYAVKKIEEGKNRAYDVDDTAGFQAYVPSRIHPSSDEAVAKTRGEILLYKGKVIDAVFTASNGGQTVSAKERWGREVPYLIAQADPYDAKAGYPRDGHGVGMSQRGAIQAAKEGLDYVQILAFYYPGTELYTMEEADSDAQAYPFAAYVATKTDPLTLRDAPNGKRIGSLPKDSRVAVLREKDGWADVVLLEGDYPRGWASLDYLRRAEGED